jgi:endonuclease/exonuclease/phosphatase family metal-dependent hydrolase
MSDFSSFSKRPRRRGPGYFFLALILLAAVGFGIQSFLAHATDESQSTAGIANNASAAAAIEADAGAPDSLAMVSWNIEWFPGRTREPSSEQEQAHFRAVRQALPSIDADIFLLQEVRNEAVVEALFADFPEYQVHIVSRFMRGDEVGLQQLAIVSRLPALAAFAEPFVEAEGWDIAPSRGFSFAALELPNGRTLLVYNVHFKSNRGDAAVNIPLREESARQILAHLDSIQDHFPDPVVVVGGDFNLLLNRPGMDHEQTLEYFKCAGFHSGWDGVPFAERVTWPARGRFDDACFDYFMVRGIAPSNSELLTDFDHLSDHRPVRHWIRLE